MGRVHFLIDEAASLQQLDSIQDAIEQYRGYAVRLILVYQSLGQLKKCFPVDEGRTMLSNTTQVFFSVNDNATADYVSNRIGESTVVVESGGSSSGSSSSWSHGGQPQYGGGSSDGVSSNWNPTARKLLKPEEVMALPRDLAICFASGVPPICIKLLKYYNEPRLGRRSGIIRRSLAACCTLAASAALCAFALGFAALTTLVVKDEPWARQFIPLEVCELLDSISSI